MTLLRLLVLLSFTLSWLGCGAPAHAPADAPAERAGAAVAPDATRPWPHERSDLPLDERIHFATLDNGLRLAWMDNPEPDRRTYLRLHVDVGSVVERDDEQGLAHFLEHMAFNGSEHFPAGTLIEWFQERGMAFGAHANASTDFLETIYRIDLPESDPDSLEDGLRVLADFAGGLLLAEEEVRREVGVIDGEERERDSAAYRVFVEVIKRRYAGTRLPQRIPIGLREVRAAFDADSVRAFYERWYRPEAMTLVLVGDLQGFDPSPLVGDVLGALPVPTTPAPLPPPLGTPTFADRVYVIPNDELPAIQMALSRLRPWRDEVPTRARLQADVPLQLARAMLNLRLSEMARNKGAAFLFAGTDSAEEFRVVDGETFSIAARPDLWQQALTTCEQELRRALEHGFQQAELDEVRADALRGLDEAVSTEATRSSASRMNELLAAVTGRVVTTTAATERDVLRPALQAATPERCHAALRAAWAEGTFSLAAIGNVAALGAQAEDALWEAFEASLAVDVAPPSAIETSAFAYASEDRAPAPIAERSHVEDLDIHHVRFANGVRLNIKPTDFKQRQILVSVRVGEGELALDPERAALAFAAGPQVANLGGVGLEAHSVDDLRRLTAGREAGVRLGVFEDHVGLGGATTAEDALLQFEITCAYLEHPGWRDEVYEQGLERLPLLYDLLEHRADGPLLRTFLPAYHGGDARFGLPALEDARAVGMDDIRAWLAPQFADGPVEVAVVGDLDVDAIVDAAAATFGHLPPRREAISYDEHRVVQLVPGLQQEHEIETEVPEVSVRVYFPTTDGRDAVTRRRLNMLAQVLGDRLREQVREELGEAYSPGARSSASAVFPGLGSLEVQSGAEPARTREVLEACLGIAADLARDGVQPDELERQRVPVLKQVRDQMRENGYWLAMLETSQSRPAILDEARSVLSDYTEVTAEHLSELARRYLPRERASWIVVRPRPADS